MESPHILVGSFRANKNEFRVGSPGVKYGKYGGGKEARTRCLKEGGDG